MFDLRISSRECTFVLPDRLARTIGAYDLDDRIVYLGNWFDPQPSLRKEDDLVRASEPEKVALVVVSHELVHDALRAMGIDVSFDYLFISTKMEDEFGMPDWEGEGPSFTSDGWRSP